MQQRIQHNLFVEFFGNSFSFYNLTYDFSYKIAYKHKIAMGLGGQCLPYDSDVVLGLSPQINYIYGKKHHFELGIGYSILWGGYDIDVLRTIPIRTGYRYQKEKGGFLWKIAFVTLYSEDLRWFPNFNFYPWGSVAFGYSFKNKK